MPSILFKLRTLFHDVGQGIIVAGAGTMERDIVGGERERKAETTTLSEAFRRPPRVSV